MSKKKSGEFNHVIPVAKPVDARDIAKGVRAYDIMANNPSRLVGVLVKTDGWYSIETGLKK